jgi:DNA-binding NarL/FixJ family response regulator
MKRARAAYIRCQTRGSLLPTRILLVDDHKLFREGIKLIVAPHPELVIVAEAASANEALSLLDHCDFDVLVVDVTLPGASGISLVRELRRRRGHQTSMVVSMHDDTERVADALVAGATAYVLKSDGLETLLAGIRAAARSERFLSPAIDAQGVRRLERSSADGGVVGPLDALTARERQVFELIVRDFSTTEIADELSISAKTVESHREHLFRKLAVHTICELVRFAARHHLLEWERRDYGAAHD